MSYLQCGWWWLKGGYWQHLPKPGNSEISHRVSFDYGCSIRQLSPYNFVWETLKRLDRATPATTLVIASSLCNIFTNTYRIVYKDITLKLPF